MRYRLTFGTALFCLAGPAAGQDIEQICSGDLITFSLPPFVAFDVDEDGRIEEDEASGCDTLWSLFDRLDLDADGALTPVEYRAFADLRQRQARSFGDDAE